MTPEECKEQMEEIQENNDPECGHIYDDSLAYIDTPMCEILRRFGYREGNDAFEKQDKWYLEDARNCWSDIMEVQKIMKPESQGKSLHELANEIRAGNRSQEMFEKVKKINKFIEACLKFHIEVDWNDPVW